MNKGWLELESDPGLFTLLVEDFGVKGVQVEEIYDLQKPIEGQVYGFIFLFKWIEERRSRRKLTQDEESFVMDDSIVNSMFFAQQVIPNSCATHALISILMNCDNLRLGDTLSKLKQFTKDMPPEDKGYAIGNVPELASAHNSHARPESRPLPEKQQGISAVRTGEAFHFVSYVPIRGSLFELDGLKPYPTDHGPWAENESWTEKFRRVITERLGMATGGEPYHDIRFNLMAVVPDRREQYQRKLEILKTNRQIVLEALQRLLDNKMVKVTNPAIHADPTATSKSLRLKPEPIITRSVAAAVREATAKAGLSLDSSPPKAEKPAKPAKSKRSSQRSGSSLGTVSEDSDPSSAVETIQPEGELETSDNPRPPSVPIRLPPELDSHNYAKSPDLEAQETASQGSAADDTRDAPELEEDEDDVDVMEVQEEPPQTKQNWQVTQSGTGSLKMKISLAGEPHVKSVSATPPTPPKSEVTEPLSIQTKFGDSSPGHGSSSTDTASEVGSFLNSPGGSVLPSSEEPSPNTSLEEKQVALTLETEYDLAEEDGLSVKTEDIQQLMDISASVSQMQEAVVVDIHPLTQQPPVKEPVNMVRLKCLGENDSKIDIMNAGQSEGLTTLARDGAASKESEKKKAQHQGFSPKDLVALLKNIEQEIKTCETNLKDERDKRRKYQVDCCRRTHNYDQFICTFLSMLAEQGHLGDLVQEHMIVKRRQGVSVGSLQRAAKPADKRRRPRPKKRR